MNGGLKIKNIAGIDKIHGTKIICNNFSLNGTSPKRLNKKKVKEEQRKIRLTNDKSGLLKIKVHKMIKNKNIYV